MRGAFKFEFAPGRICGCRIGELKISWCSCGAWIGLDDVGEAISRQEGFASGVLAF